MEYTSSIKLNELIQTSGMNLKQFARYFKIPYRTIQNWNLGIRPCPGYLLELMEYKLNKEAMIGQGERNIMCIVIDDIEGQE